jgi:hypothetical protein
VPLPFHNLDQSGFLERADLVRDRFEIDVRGLFMPSAWNNWQDHR